MKFNMLFLITSLLASMAFAQGQPSGTPAKCLERTQDEGLDISVDSLLKKISPSSQNKARQELLELSACFALNLKDTQQTLNLYYQNHFSDKNLNARLRTHFLEEMSLITRKIYIFNRYNILDETGIQGKTLDEVLTTHTQRTRKITSSNTYFIKENVISKSDTPFKRALSLLYNWASPTLAHSGDLSSRKEIIYSAPIIGCDGQKYWRQTHAKKFETNPTSGLEKLVKYTIDNYSTRDDCKIINGSPITNVIIRWFNFFSYTYDYCTADSMSQVLIERNHFVRFFNEIWTARRATDNNRMFKGIQSDCGCSESKPELASDGTGPSWCAYSRYQTEKWESLVLEDGTPEPKSLGPAGIKITAG